MDWARIIKGLGWAKHLLSKFGPYSGQALSLTRAIEVKRPSKPLSQSSAYSRSFCPANQRQNLLLTLPHPVLFGSRCSRTLELRIHVLHQTFDNLEPWSFRFSLSMLSSKSMEYLKFQVLSSCGQHKKDCLVHFELRV
ncbi:hypothetical protein EUGRSUZ_H03513 [Eucalyptus grandis]|uniref:Uncharacterized protein n=2 Tax=Eucalyptus grandis TaxID=71139 RepID=A0ACC3JUF4_EUCGR|nr:hypothetical protein EUGRSUZ_H03513 [Eucalyptus grandis]